MTGKLFADSEFRYLADAVAKRKTITLPAWDVADHACRFCFGRVLERVSKSGKVLEVKCSECGAHAIGGHEKICCCGADCGSLGLVLECALNPVISPEAPQQIMVRERRVEPKK